jgi:hypothetical protein
MQYFHLEQPPDDTVLCDLSGCAAIADYLEIEENGTEHHLCAFHTRSQIHASRLASRIPNPNPSLSPHSDRLSETKYQVPNRRRGLCPPAS